VLKAHVIACFNVEDVRLLDLLRDAGDPMAAFGGAAW
jgi:hypothetical protein